ncbi:MAG: flavodoxin family protein [Methanomicrobiales archaeon]|nr:flavodoxin family protein [Methanomicrobiales archaeon]
MHVVAFNGSPRSGGNTDHLLTHVLDVLEREGIGTELVKVGGTRLQGCTACGKCVENRDLRCVIEGDIVNDCIEKMVAADGIIIGSPTHFADLTPDAKALIDRAGYVGRANGGLYARKVGAAVVAMRRAGGIHVYDSINHFFGISSMFTVGSTYWNIGIGLTPGDVENDAEGIETMKNLGANMAWIIKKIRG